MMFAFTLLVALAAVHAAQACSCLHSHPQEHFCSADFVGLVQVRRPSKPDRTSYHIRVKRFFKGSPKARMALDQGLLWTGGASAATCGANSLERGRYLVAGYLAGSKPTVTLCNFVTKWSELSRRQRKGFQRLYKQGCECKVRGRWSFRNKDKMACKWTTEMEPEDCQELYSMCVPSGSGCDWLPSNAYRSCMKTRRNNDIP